MPHIRFGIFRQSMKNLGQIGRFDSKIFRLFSLDRHCAIRSKMASEIAKTFEHFDLFFNVLNPCYVTRQFKVRTWCIGNYNVPNKSPIQLRAAPFFLPWMANSWGWGLLNCQIPRDGEGKRRQMARPPSTLQHFALIEQSSSTILSILMCDFLFQLTSSFVIVLF